VLGLGGRGKLSEKPVLGALKAERGNVGRDLGPFLRAPTPGDMGGLGMLSMMIRVSWTVATCPLSVAIAFNNSNTDPQSFPRFTSFSLLTFVLNGIIRARW
jgi:hypothetical protein